MKQFPKVVFVVLVALASAGQSLAQNPVPGKRGQELIDSLLKELKSDKYVKKEDTDKVTILGNLSFAYYPINPNEGLKYAQQSLDLSTKLGWDRGIAFAYTRMGVSYQFKSDYPKALEYYLKADTMFNKIGYKKGIAGSARNLGTIYYYLSDYPKALTCALKHLKMSEELDDKYGIALATNSVGIIYMNLKDDAKALEYFIKALKMNQDQGNTYVAAGITGNIGSVYEEQGDYPKALEYYFKVLKISQELGDKNLEAMFTGNVCETYSKQKNYAMAIAYGMKALQMDDAIGATNNAAFALTYIGNAYLAIAEDPGTEGSKLQVKGEMQTGKYNEAAIPAGKTARLQLAIQYLKRGLDTATKIHSLEVMQPCYEGLAKAYQLSGNYKLAMENFQNFNAIKDSVFSKDNEKKLVQTEMQNDYDRQHLADSMKTAEREKVSALQLQRQRSYTFMGIAGALLLLGFSFFMLRNNKLLGKEKKRSDDLLLNILPDEVASELKTTGSSAARHYEDVTVLFTDFVNFTKAGEKMSPQALIDELHTCFKTFDEITARYNIEKIKTIGDAYLAVAGLPLPDARHAEHIVRAAIEINNFMDSRYAILGDKTFEVRIGIHSGSVVAGIVGVKKFAYDIWGDTVNTAARMEQNSEAGKINISQTTYELVKDKFDCVYRGEIDAKNKGMLKMYYVV